MRPTSRDQRPVNLDLGTIHLPITAYASITHRVTGVAMFVASFLMLWALDQSLASEASFDALADTLASLWAKLLIWATASALSYHALAGLKHLVMDAGFGETMRGGVIGARVVFVLAAFAAALWGVALW
ncbi:MAG: succinate dehydrogenase, cytochrome b556 subunit [Luminiphilus sp.]|nr:succinate dehydrogenase, cytochrome b556 subunit [Luminiphilus sp.]